ncbi:MAG: AAA family ATPase, partial [Oscillospiraceae bacterium]|nr:AAA family ATPase [Oscillospiraceae bacterium]
MNVEELAEINGTIENVIYQNDENGYTVLRVRDENDSIITVVGCFPFAAAGEYFTASGQWTTHSVHGQQFKAEYSQRSLPDTTEAIYSFLCSGNIKGIGPATASLIVNRFGVRSLAVIENEPEKLAEIRGISKAKAADITKSFGKQMRIRNLTEYICSYGLRPVLALRLYRFYGDNAIEVLKENPYILAADHIGGSFAEADAIALESGMNPVGKNRIKAAVLFELSYNTKNGHCFIPREKLAVITSQLIGVDEELILEAISDLAAEMRIITEQIAGCDACYLAELYEAENDTAIRFAEMSARIMPEANRAEKLAAEIDTIAGFECTKAQREIVAKCLKHQLLVITGGPGTGKTTSINMLLAMFERLNIRPLLTAPTGRAAKRITEVTGYDASTIHRLLGAKFDEDTEHVVYEKCESDPLDCDAVILDETSMVDILLIYALIRALPEHARLILVGDADQLPSVGPGKVFSAVIRSEVVPTVKLTEIYRQNSDSQIIKNA